MLYQGQIKIHFKDGTQSIHPELNKNNIVRLFTEEIARIEHYKPVVETRGRPKKNI